MNYRMRLRAALNRECFFAVGMIALLYSMQFLAQPFDLGLWTVSEIGLEWLLVLRNALVAGALMTLAYCMSQAALPARTPLRGLLSALAILPAALAAAVLIGTDVDARIAPLSAETVLVALRWAVIGLTVGFIHLRQQQVHARRAEAARLQLGEADLEREEAAQRLTLLQAQIEPHFLFNTLANARSLYRSDAARGEAFMASLLRYLRAALPRVRRVNVTLRDELELARTYLELAALRMHPRLSWAIEADPSTLERPFPPLVLLTLVENAVKHGVGPASRPGRIIVKAERHSDDLYLSVTDNGVGLTGIATGGSGVGLANVRRQLAARYGTRADMALVQGDRGGTVATLRVPAGDTAVEVWGALSRQRGMS